MSVTQFSEASTTIVPDDPPDVELWKPVVFGALAGGMGWGIRGQYGHETGAMIAGFLVSATLVLLCCRRLSGFDAVRAVALGTIAMGFGGSMTYGQTVGLTHDAGLIGNKQALLWGLLGLAIKGGIWIGFAGAFLGMGLSGKRYRATEVLLLMSALLAMCWLGIRALNEPFDPAHQILPKIYFSDDWRWEPGMALKPRREVWGGMLWALVGLLIYTRFRRNDSLAFRLGLWGILGGGLGFPLGQCLQAYHAWNPEIFQEGIWRHLDSFMNWWNWMETSFGAVMGGVLGLGLWLNRKWVRPSQGPATPGLPSWAAWALLTLHLGLLACVEFLSVRWVDRLYDFGLVLGLLPVCCVVGDRRWPYWILPITVLPIAGKTVRELVYQQPTIPPAAGWLLYFLLPLAAAAALGTWLQRAGRPPESADQSLRPMLLLATWLFFALNFAFFRFPWPWEAWTARTPNGIAFSLCAVGLTWVAFRSKPKQSHSEGS